MLCTNCKKENAVFFYQQNIGGKKSSVALCAECSKKFTSPMKSFDFFEPYTTVKTTNTTDSSKVCNLCGLRFENIRAMGKVGCPECYNTFKEELGGIIQRIHGNAVHRGSSPENSGYEISTASEEELLKEELNKAISAENYEEAARLRDAIKALKGEA